jgi:hypothetical protein
MMKTRLSKRASGLLALLSIAAVSCTGTGAPTVPPPGGGGDKIGINPELPAEPGLQTKLIKYPRANIPAATATRDGMIWNRFTFNIAKPCTNCFIKSIQANLKKPDGTVANVNTGQMLHHMVLAANGTGKTDPTCGSFFGTGQRFFASGNERTRFLYPPGYGYKVNTGDSWTLISDFMNMSSTVAPVDIEMTFTYVNASPSIKPITPIWLDVAQCGISEVPSRTGSYSYVYTWTVNVPGKLLGIGGHLHDGGTHMNIKKGNGQLICNSVAGYGGPGFEMGGGMDHDDGGMDHGDVHQALSSMTQCLSSSEATPVAQLNRGDRVVMTAYYNSNLHAQHGTEPVMGISVGWILPD